MDTIKSLFDKDHNEIYLRYCDFNNEWEAENAILCCEDRIYEKLKDTSIKMYFNRDVNLDKFYLFECFDIENITYALDNLTWDEDKIEELENNNQKIYIKDVLNFNFNKNKDYLILIWDADRNGEMFVYRTNYITDELIEYSNDPILILEFDRKDALIPIRLIDLLKNISNDLYNGYNFYTIDINTDNDELRDLFYDEGGGQVMFNYDIAEKEFNRIGKELNFKYNSQDFEINYILINI